MSSYDAKPELRGEDLQNLSVQWGYAASTTSGRKVSRENDSRFAPRLRSAMHSLFCALLTLAGAASTATLITWLSYRFA